MSADHYTDVFGRPIVQGSSVLRIRHCSTLQYSLHQKIRSQQVTGLQVGMVTETNLDMVWFSVKRSSQYNMFISPLWGSWTRIGQIAMVGDTGTIQVRYPLDPDAQFVHSNQLRREGTRCGCMLYDDDYVIAKDSIQYRDQLVQYISHLQLLYGE